MNRAEEQIHRSIVQYLTVAHRNLLWWHTPNGGHRSKAEGGIFKALGVLAGVPDLTIILPGGKVGFLEVKADRGELTPSQTAFAERAAALGAAWQVVRSIDDVQVILARWLAPAPAVSELNPPDIIGKPASVVRKPVGWGAL